MTNSTMGKLALGLLTALPLVYVAWFIWFVFSGVMGTGGPTFTDEQFRNLFVTHLAVMALGFGLLVFYVVHLFRKTALSTEMKVLWLLLMFFFSTLVMIVYWYLYIWRDAPRAGPTVAA